MKKKTSGKLRLNKIKVAKLTNVHQETLKDVNRPTITRCSAMGCPSVLVC